VNITWQTLSFELKTQVSIPLKILTPYLGAGAIFALSQTDYFFKTTSKIYDDADLKKALDENKFAQTDDGFKIDNKTEFGITARVYGGFSFNIAYVRLDLTGMYEFLGNNFGATVGLRFQL
jgi:hypothetical protein